MGFDILNNKKSRFIRKAIILFMGLVVVSFYICLLLPQKTSAYLDKGDGSGNQITAPTSADMQASADQAKLKLKADCTKAGGTINQTTGYCEKGGKVLTSDEIAKIINTTSTTSSSKVTLESLEKVLEGLIIAAAGFMFGFAIFEYIGAGGDSKKIGNAKGYLMSAVTALIALVLVRMFLKP